jgi:ADP-ribose pyrophosphatase YjhB (NUDIX family)
MRRAARVIIIKDNNLLVMHRNKFGVEYDTLPGGNIEIGETPEQAAKRETDEETSVELANPTLVFIEHADPLYGDQYIFLCDYVSGEPSLKPGGEEDLINKLGKNLYKPDWLPLTKLPSAPFLSEELKKHILHGTEYGWPKEPLEFTSTRDA